MAKFSEYGISADDRDGGTILSNKRITAISLESAWHKAVSEAFEAIEPGTGDQPGTIYVWRIQPASESHG